MGSNENERVLRASSGDHQAYGELIGAYQGMVFAVALNVTGNHSDSEDVVQEAFLRAYQKLRTLSDPSKFGPWLHTIARRLALQLLRERRRVPVSESEETLDDRADPDALTPAELYAKAALSQSLWAEVAELPPRTREAILLYYVEDFSIRGAASFLGISEGAMKMRLDFGRERLREVLTQKMEDELRRQRPSEKMRAVILAALPASEAPTAITSAWGAWATWVTGTKAAVAALLALTFGAGLLFAFSDRLPISRIPTEVAALSVETASKPDTAAARPVSSPENVPAVAGPPTRSVSSDQQNAATVSRDETPPPDGQAMCVCEVMQPNATPVRGVTVNLDRISQPEDGAESHAFHREARTNELGEVDFDRIPDGTYILSAQDGQDVARVRAVIGMYLRQRLILQSGEVFAGVVQDQEGKRVSGARIVVLRTKSLDSSATRAIPDYTSDNVIQGWYRRAVAETRNDGSFTALLPRGNRWCFLVEADGFATMNTGEIVLTQRAEYALGHGGTVAGRVMISGSGKPAPGMLLEIAAVDNEEERYETVAEAGGAFAFANLRPAKYVLGVHDSKMAISQPEQTVEVRSGESSEVEVDVTPGSTISGRVTDRDSGKGVANAQVRTERKFSRTITTDANGDFRLSGIAAGRLALSVKELAGFRVSDEGRRKELIVEPGVDQTGVELTLINGVDAPPVLRGCVLDADGKPMAGAFVNARIEEGHWENALVRADANGAYSVGGLFVTGNLKVRAFLPGLSSQEKGPLTLPTSGLDGVDLILEQTGGIVGRVVGKSGKPFGVFDTYIDLLNAWHVGVWGQATRTVMRDGAFRLTDLPAGKYELYVDVPLYRGRTGIRLPQGVVEVAAGQFTKDVVLEFDDESYNQQVAQESNPEEIQRRKEAERERDRNDWGVKGQVVDANTGAPVPAFDLESYRMGITRSSVKEPQGRFTVDPGEGLTGVLKVVAPHYAPQTVTVTADQVRDRFAQVVIKLNPGAIVEGTVIDPDGNPVAGAKVYANELPDEHVGNRASDVSTDSDGAFRLDTLDRGPQRICVEHPAYALRWTDVTPAVGRTAPITVKLTHGGTIEGVVTSAGAPLANVGISCRIDGGEGPGRRDRLLKTDDAGHFVLGNLAPVQIDVAAIPPSPNPRDRGNHMQKQSVLVQEGVTTRADFTFALEDARIRGTITIHGEPAGPGWASVHRLAGEVSESWNSAPVDESGAYETDPLPAGEYTLDVMVTAPAGLRLSQKLTVTLDAGETAVKDVDFSGMGSVSGTVSGLLAGEQAMVAALPGDVPFPPHASHTPSLLSENVALANVQDSAYRLEALPPGTYTIRVVSSSWPSADTGTFRAGSDLVKIDGEENVVLNLTIEDRR